MNIVYEDWRDRQFPPEIIGLYTKETNAHKSVEDKERELISDGYKIGEDVRVICKKVDVSDKCADDEHISYERLKRIAQLLLVGLLIDGIDEAFIYMNETVGLSAKEAAILLSDSGEFREEEYESYLQESV